jgi:hypothetical protein
MMLRANEIGEVKEFRDEQSLGSIARRYLGNCRTAEGWRHQKGSYLTIVLSFAISDSQRNSTAKGPFQVP